MIEFSEEARRRIESTRAAAELEYTEERDALDLSGLPHGSWCAQVKELATGFLQVQLDAELVEIRGLLRAGADPMEIRLFAESRRSTLVKEVLDSRNGYWPLPPAPHPQLGARLAKEVIAVDRIRVLKTIRQSAGWKELQQALMDAETHPVKARVRQAQVLASAPQSETTSYGTAGQQASAAVEDLIAPAPDIGTNSAQASLASGKNNSADHAGTKDEKAVRRAQRDAYKAECRSAGVRLTDLMIAQEAKKNWTTRDPIQKWMTGDQRYEGRPDRLIRSVFTKKPHLQGKH
jgi:hypothetical protein